VDNVFLAAVVSGDAVAGEVDTSATRILPVAGCELAACLSNYKC